jgi:predicted nucleic acid-binding protein
MISTFTAFFDANVFYGARLRSLMLYLAQTKMFRARWSEHIHDEWMRNLLLKRPDLSVADLAGTRRQMDAAVLDALVTGYQPLIETLTLPDPGDRHVLAAAIVCRASCIVTFNLADFPADVLAPFGLHAVHPDNFLLDTESIDPSAFAEAVHSDLTHYVAPPLTLEAYVEDLRKAGIPKTAEHVAELKVLLSTSGDGRERREEGGKAVPRNRL